MESSFTDDPAWEWIIDNQDVYESIQLQYLTLRLKLVNAKENLDVEVHIKHGEIVGEILKMQDPTQFSEEVMSASTLKEMAIALAARFDEELSK